MFIDRKYLCISIVFLTMTIFIVGCSEEKPTPAAKAEVPTAPPTQIISTNTPTSIPTATPTQTASSTPPSPTNIPTSIPTETPIPTASPTPAPTDTPTIIPTPTESIYWHYPRHGLNNTAAYTLGRWQLVAEPYSLWSIENEEYSFMNLYPVAGDLDGDGHAEYVIGRFDPQTLQGFLTVYNVDDGSVLWEMQLDRDIHWSPPVITDLNNDGQLDLIFATQRQRTAQDAVARIYALNGKDGSVIWQKPFPEGGLGMTVADVNADGWMEIIINDYQPDDQGGRKLHLLNGRDGSQIWERSTCGSQYGQPTAADLDGDGLLEIISHHHNYEWPKAVERLIVWDHLGNELWSFESAPTEAQAANAPEILGRTPCESWESTTVTDYNNDGELEIGFGSRCSYYLLDVHGNLIWDTVFDVEGWGTIDMMSEDGSEYPHQTSHGTGGYYYDAAVGNIDDDPALEIVFAHWPEYYAEQYFPSGRFVYQRIEPSNEVWALDGADGSVQWVFEGTYIPELSNLQQMWVPILVDLTGDGQLDVLVLSDDRHLYAVNGATGEKMLEYFSYLPPQWEARHLTFIPEGDLGVVIYSAHKRGRIYVLKALVIAERVSE